MTDRLPNGHYPGCETFGCAVTRCHGPYPIAPKEKEKMSHLPPPIRFRFEPEQRGNHAGYKCVTTSGRRLVREDMPEEFWNQASDLWGQDPVDGSEWEWGDDEWIRGVNTGQPGADPEPHAVEGVSYRNWLAGQIIAAVVSRSERYSAQSLAREAVQITDSLIEALGSDD